MYTPTPIFFYFYTIHLLLCYGVNASEFSYILSGQTDAFMTVALLLCKLLRFIIIVLILFMHVTSEALKKLTRHQLHLFLRLRKVEI